MQNPRKYPKLQFHALQKNSTGCILVKVSPSNKSLHDESLQNKSHQDESIQPKAFMSEGILEYKDSSLKGF